MLTAAGRGAARRVAQTAVIVLIAVAAAAAGTLGLALAADANAAFQNAFATDHGADLAVTLNAAKVTTAELAKTAKLTGVRQAAGPYPETYITLGTGPGRQPAPGGGPLIPRGSTTRTAGTPGKGWPWSAAHR